MMELTELLTGVAFFKVVSLISLIMILEYKLFVLV
jgi:hypothetical protein